MGQAFTYLMLPIELLAGLLFGLGGLAAAYLLRSLRPDWGLVFSLTGLVGLTLIKPRWLPEILLLWEPLLVAVVIVVAGSLAGLFGARRDETPWIGLVSVGGAWATVPDTELISVLLGIAAPFAAGVYPWRILSQSRLGAGMAGALLAIVVILDGGRRSGAVIGAAGAVAVAALPPRDRYWLIRHLVLVAVWARIAGRASTAAGALFLGLGFTLLVVGLDSWWMRMKSARGRG
ncbi:MAG: hypothetical protein ACRDWA_03885 [Acidimicrobiia bacterium]